MYAQVAPFLDVCLLQGAPGAARKWSVGAQVAALVNGVSGGGGKKKADKGKGSAGDMHEGYMLAVLTQFGGCVRLRHSRPHTRTPVTLGRPVSTAGRSKVSARWCLGLDGSHIHKHTPATTN